MLEIKFVNSMHANEYELARVCIRYLLSPLKKEEEKQIRKLQYVRATPLSLP